MLRRNISPLLVALLSLSLAPRLATADLADAFKQAPADAPIVVLVKSVAGLNAKFKAIANKVAPGEVPAGEFLDSVLFKTVGVKLNQMDKTGAVLIVFAELPADTQGEPKVVVLIPVKDYKAFVAANEVQVKDGKETINARLPLFLASVGKYAAISEFPEAVDKVAKSAKPLALTAEENELANAADVFVHVNVPAVMPLLESLEKDLAKAANENGPAAGPGLPGMGPANLQPLMQLVLAIGKDIDAIDAGLTLSEAGADVRLLLRAKDGSAMADMFSTAGKVAGPLVSGVPITNSVILGGFANVIKADNEFSKRLTTLAAKIGSPAQAEESAKMAELGRQFSKLITRQSFNLMASTAGEKTTLPLSMAIVAETTDGPAAMAAARAYAKEMIKALPGMLAGPTTSPAAAQPGDAPAAAAAPAGPVIDYAEAAETVAGVKVDKLTLTPAALAMMGPAAGMLPMILGNELVARVGVKGNMVVVTIGGGAAGFEEALKAVDAKTSLDQVAGVQQVKAYLVPDASAVFYISADKIVNMVIDAISGMFGAQMPSLAKVDPPVVMSMGVTGKIGQARLFVPMALFEAIGKFAESMKPKAQPVNGGPGAVSPQSVGPNADTGPRS